MAYHALVMPDVEEGAQYQDNVFFATSDKQIETCVRQCAAKNPTVTICVYRLDQLQKLMEAPKYARYKVLTTGEVVPV